MKVVRRIHSVTRTVEISETALAHRKIVPFNNYGDAAGDVDVTPKQVLSLVPESMKTIAARRGERDAADGTFSGSKTVTCPICGGPHFKIHCPNKHLSQTQARLDALNAGPGRKMRRPARPPLTTRTVATSLPIFAPAPPPAAPSPCPNPASGQKASLPRSAKATSTPCSKPYMSSPPAARSPATTRPASLAALPTSTSTQRRPCGMSSRNLTATACPSSTAFCSCASLSKGREIESH
eukprot:gnl/Ergobibamus_cyprinoides/2243.p1 GENE.gnl/Ergobibamus_cyprinoides/2243~~gnl/Ergobibamus_cyprinoides/2243.p1  ORF type:complete len:272 (+),score=17.38 gnl/Ergobibamus_cyprinoides/2243:103-816(+)